MSDICQAAGGWVYGKVFHDQNGNGIYDGHLGETGFRSGVPVQLELVNCQPASTNCDRYDYSNPVNYFRRTIDITLPNEESGNFALCPDAVNGGCFRFNCPDCFGDFKLVLSRTLEPDFEGWNNSPVRWGDYREGWTFSDDPHVTCKVRNNFDRFQSSCFSLREDVKVVLDFGILFNEDMQEGDKLDLGGMGDSSPFVTYFSQSEQIESNSPFMEASTDTSISSSTTQETNPRRRRRRRKGRTKTNRRKKKK